MEERGWGYRSVFREVATVFVSLYGYKECEAIIYKKQNNYIYLQCITTCFPNFYSSCPLHLTSRCNVSLILRQSELACSYSPRVRASDLLTIPVAGLSLRFQVAGHTKLVGIVPNNEATSS